MLVTSPDWPGHRAAVEAAGGRTRQIATDANTGYLVTAEALEAAWVPGTRAVVLANPANPTGVACDAQCWADIAAWAAARDVWVIGDDVYQAFVYDREHVHALRAAPRLRERCIVVDSVSKAHSMTGWRVGWVAGPASIVAPGRPGCSPVRPRTSPSSRRLPRGRHSRQAQPDSGPRRRPIASGVTGHTAPCRP